MSVKTRPNVRLQDIARSSGVSVATVSMALSDHPNVSLDTKRKIRACSERLGYSPGERRRANTRLKRIGFMMIGCDLTNLISATRVQSLLNVADESRIRLELGCVQRDVESSDTAQQVIDFARQLDGLILEGHLNTTLLRQLSDAGIRYVVTGLVRDDTLPPFVDYHRVQTDVTAMARFATEWHLFRGHRRIGFACSEIESGFWVDRWLDGYRLALMRADVPIDLSLIRTAGQDYLDADPLAVEFTSMKEPPSAYVLPGWGQTVSLSKSLERMGHALPSDRFVSSMLLELAQQRDIGAYPLVCLDSAQIARVSLDRLASVCQNEAAAFEDVHIPFVTLNIKTIDRSKP